MIKKAIEILGRSKSYDNLLRGIHFFLSEEYPSSTPSTHTTMPPEPRALRKISELIKSETTILATYEFNSRMYFGARLTDQSGTVYFSTTWAGVDAFIKSKKTLRQLFNESQDVWADSMPALDGTTRSSVVEQIKFVDEFYKDIPAKVRLSIL
jgi:hypothetical protein